jgi:hypothetical protein
MQSPAGVLMVWPYVDDYTPKRHICLSGLTGASHIGDKLLEGCAGPL